MIANVDTRGELLHDHALHSRFDLPLELCSIIVLTALVTEKQIAQCWGARQAPNMRGKHTVIAPMHGVPRSRLRMLLIDEA